jgi:hypothetical protein
MATQQSHEVRYKGNLLGHLPEAAAGDYVRRRLEHPVEGEVFDAKDFTVAPRKPWELHSRGNLVDTYDTETAAHEALDHDAERLAKRMALELAVVEGFFEVKEAPEVTAPPPPPVQKTRAEQRLEGAGPMSKKTPR